MNEPISQLNGTDFDEAMDFLNRVFGEHEPHDFARLLPSIYRPTESLMACNYAIRSQGNLQAIVGLFPIDWQVGGTTLRIAGIGGVSTHPQARGAGYMKRLMRHCVELMPEQGYHLSYLGGQRQRYGYFGYEKCGWKQTFSVSPTNLRHCYSDAPGIAFKALAADQTDYLSQAFQLHQAQPTHCLRPAEDFYYFLLSWLNQPYAAFDGNGAMVGYLVANNDQTRIDELAAVDDETALRMVRAWVADHANQSVAVTLPPSSLQLGHLLGRIGERVGVGGAGNFQLFDWAAVCQALLRQQHRDRGLSDGAVVLGIDGYGAIRLQVAGTQADCTRVDEAPDLQCDPATALRLLLGPLPPALVANLPPAAAALQAWCPLPLGFSAQDGV